jgi:hypothetical protein
VKLFAPILAKKDDAPRLVKALIAVQALTAVSYTCLAIYLLKGFTQEPIEAGTSSGFHGWMPASALVGLMVIIPWVAFGALVRGKPWGRNLAVFFALLNVIAIVGANLERHTRPETSEVAVALFFISFSIMLFLRPVGQFFQPYDGRKSGET